ncbi:threonylcarbamoyladenosine tRNA methylthiotransferase MtaB [Sphingomonas guangdongensis]|uniref:Threonylcarbamoyladenosine tRNA methylthiotransferase MtaB n=1 Tax=Sphingomonas guangdongensis TaxID=1141890 RepID=A0A285R0M1_9SPHN|nr:threonylcarbamoyladenosine tRNA methylthiotransferase MtaB [Sphingomonas guangdongensis]
MITLGCRLNIAESEHIRALLGSRDVTVVNSCAVTAEALKASRAAIRRARRERPGAELVVTGCAATIDPAGLAALPEVDRVVTNLEKLTPAAWDAPAPAPPARFAGHARALVEVQNGCDHACTFCIIPTGRGASRSVPAGSVVERVQELVAAGHREVVLTGVDLTSYGADLPGAPTLGLLVERILRLVPDLPRLRLSSLDGIEIDDRLFDLVTGEPRIAPHVHLSLQAGDDLILKRMKRRHSRAQSVALVERLRARRPAIAIGADLIAGFPTESDAAHANTAALIADAQIVHAHIFPYSPREGTPATRMPQVPREVVKTRAAELRDRADVARRHWLSSLIGTRQQVLVEAPGTRGHAANFAPVALATSSPIGTLVDVDVSASDGTTLIGTPA